VPPLGGPNVGGRGFYSDRASLCVTHCPCESINIRSVPMNSLLSYSQPPNVRRCRLLDRLLGRRFRRPRRPRPRPLRRRRSGRRHGLRRSRRSGRHPCRPRPRRRTRRRCVSRALCASAGSGPGRGARSGRNSTTSVPRLSEPLPTSDQQAGSTRAHICAGTAPISAHSRTGGPLRPTSGMGPRVVGA
jgi:hypothetical protein